MRIIAGKYRRRKLLANPGTTTRPITDRAKERLFENLGGQLGGERVADVFAGTGSMGIEALSRGAARCVFIEKDRKAHELLHRNVRTLNIEADVVCWKTDVLRCSFQPKGVAGFVPYDLIFFDPPFPMLVRMQPDSPMFRAWERLARPRVSSDDVLLVLRAPSRHEVPVPAHWRREWMIEEGAMDIHVFSKNIACPLDDVTAPE